MSTAFVVNVKLMHSYNVVILSSGRGSRLADVLKGLPKCLVPVAGKAAIIRQWEYWSAQPGFNKMALITHSALLVRKFLELNGLRDCIEVIAHEESDGSANALRKVPEKFVGSYVIANWCDVLLQEPIGQFPSNMDFCATNGSDCRFKLIDGKLVNVDQGGDVIGIYGNCEFVVPKKPFPDGADFADCCESHSFFNKPVKNVLHFGNMNQLTVANNSLPQANSNKGTQLVFEDGLVIKKGAAHESGWYRQAELAGIDTLYCGVQGNDLVMRQAFGDVWQHKSALSRAKAVQSRIIGNMVTSYKSRVNYSAMVYTRISDRYREIMSVLSDVSREDFYGLAWEITVKLNQATQGMEFATFGHFDLQWNNLLLSDGGVYPCDPGGSTFKWGKPGPWGYEKGKVLYGYYTWCPLYNGSLKVASDEIGLPPHQYIDDPIARLWCAAHLLAAPSFFSQDFVRMRYAMNTNYAIAKELADV